jgi:hypothetical protein
MYRITVLKNFIRIKTKQNTKLNTLTKGAYSNGDDLTVVHQ